MMRMMMMMVTVNIARLCTGMYMMERLDTCPDRGITSDICVNAACTDADV